ncbi:hypothetical protein HY085_01855 [Candidatus Gottesmanbacteria bacterium]|nr:hypothetical protein [Candidatus Gottesmanbacteria bacterium]
MFWTADFGHSDIWHFNFALKFFLSQALKQGYLPFWSKDLGMGFPLLGEGQIGIFNIFNLVLFKFLDPVTAFNLSFIIIFLTIFSGSYLFGRVINLKKFSSLFLGIIFSLSGIFITHIVHFNLIQSASFLPWEFFLAEKYLQTKKLRWLGLFSLILSQQIYSGFQQMVLISLAGLFFYILFKKPKSLIFIGLFSLLGFLLTAPQLLASWETIRQTTRTNGVPLSSMVNYPYPPIHLLTFLNPYLLGDPRNGTYPPFGINWGIFWESTGYIGILPLVLVLISLKNFRKNLIFWIILGVSLILLLGKYTPFFFLFQLPPLNMFRVPARWLFLFIWCLTILAAQAFDKIRFKFLIFTIALVDLGFFVVTYNGRINSKTWLAPPEAVNILKADPDWSRKISFFPFVPWNRVFLAKGWSDTNLFLSARNNLDPNENLFWNISSADVYAGLFLKRWEYFRAALNTGVKEDPLKTFARVSSSSAKLLSIAGIKYIISPLEIRPEERTGITFFATASAQPLIRIYKNNNAYPHAYLTRNYLVAQNIPDLVKKLSDPQNQAVILEKTPNIPYFPDLPNPALVTKNEDLEVEIETQSTVSALLILSDSYYPGWQAFINDKPTEILPANLNQRAIIVPEGSWRVRFVYRPFALANILPWLHL